MYLRKIISVILAMMIAVCIVSIMTPQARAAEEPVQSADGTVSIVRLGGADRFETANRIADEGWKKATTAVLANAYTYADALAGAPLAYAYDAPILLTQKDAIPQSVKTELKKLGVKKVILLGGTAAISAAVETDLKKSGLAVVRLGGKSRYETAVKIAEALEQKCKNIEGYYPDIFIASGENYPDALSASPVAAVKYSPILYSPSSGILDNITAKYIKGSSIDRAIILGGVNAVGKEIVNSLSKAGIDLHERIGGSDRYETSRNIAFSNDVIYTDKLQGKLISLATGKNFPDALAGSVLAAKQGSMLLLADNSIINSEAQLYLTYKAPDKAYVFGDDGVISDSTVKKYIDPSYDKRDVRISDGKNYKWVVKPSVQADDISVIRCNRPLWYKSGKNDDDIIGEDGNSLGTHIYDSVSLLLENGMSGLIDYNGKTIADAKFFNIYTGIDQKYFLDGRGKESSYTLDDKHNLVKLSPYNTDIVDITDTCENYVYLWVEGRGLYRQDDGSLDKYGDVYFGKVSPLIAAQYVKKTDYREGHILFSNENKYILLKDGKPINNTLYDDTGCFANNVIPVKKNGKWGYVNSSGKTVVPFELNPCWYAEDIGSVIQIKPFNASNGYIAVCKNNQYALYDISGNIVIDYGVFERIRPVYEGKCWVRQNGLWGVITLK